MGPILVSTCIAACLAFGSISAAAPVATTTATDVADRAPVWSADGKRIAFQRWTGVGRRSRLTVLEIDPRGGRPRVLARVGQGLWAAIAPDFSAVAVEHADRGIEVVDVESGKRRSLARSGGSDLAWSPDSSKLAFVQFGAGVSTIDLHGGGTRVLGAGAHPAWSPDGTRLAYMAYVGDPTRNVITVARADGTGPRLQLGSGFLPTWAPDGTRLAFVADGLFVADAATGAARRYPQATFTGFSAPQWSRDGRRIAYTAEDGRAVSLDLETARRTYLTRRHVWTLAWAPSGNVLAASVGDPECRRPGVGLIAGDGSFVRKLTLDCRRYGTSGHDRLLGSDLRDLLFGRAGDDRIFGRDGDDRIDGGPGQDAISCGPGRDVAIADRRDRVAADCERVARR